MPGLVKIGQELVEFLVRLECPGTGKVIDRDNRANTLPTGQFGHRNVPGIAPPRRVLRAVRRQDNCLLSTAPSAQLSSTPPHRFRFSLAVIGSAAGWCLSKADSLPVYGADVTITPMALSASPAALEKPSRSRTQACPRRARE
jgi:hypothetical protein